ncbi:MAG: hypothetical protein HC778_07215 [Chamaesiphon sp. CSU_1_12]|nr:hypothetical protein [Chamaesiphon sp. CSU_1_12]
MVNYLVIAIAEFVIDRVFGIDRDFDSRSICALDRQIKLDCDRLSCPIIFDRCYVARSN